MSTEYIYTPEFDDDLKARLIEGIEREMGDRTIEDLENERDTRLVLLLKMLRETETAR